MKDKVYEIYDKRNIEQMSVHPGAVTGVWEVAEDFLIACAGLFPNSNIRSIETGLGLSTAVFSNFGWTHKAIMPSFDEKNQLLRWMVKNSVATDKLEVVVEFSYNEVVKSDTQEFDFVFIDGNHGFPHPFIDYFFLSQRLKVNGFLAIDDIDLEVPSYLFQTIKKRPYWRVHEQGQKWVILELIARNLVASEDWNS
jgi:hypothetical protein